MTTLIGGPADGHPLPLPEIIWVATVLVDGRSVPLLDRAGRIVTLPPTPSPEAEVVLDRAACQWEAYQLGTTTLGSGQPAYRWLPRHELARHPLICRAAGA